MKLALVMLPKDGPHDLIVEVDSNNWPAVVLVNRRKLIYLLLAILACSIALVVSSYSYAHWLTKYWHQPVLLRKIIPGGSPSASITPAQPTVHEWNHADPISRGDRVVVHPAFGHPPRVEQVAGAPKEMVVVRNGAAVEGIYILGANKYFVEAGPGHAHIVGAADITGVVHAN